MKPRKLLILTALLAPCRLLAQRESADYTVPAESADPVGSQQASASYASDGSAGGISAVSGGNGGIVGKAGFAGQLYEVTAFVLTATGLTVNELATRQLQPVLTLDDETTLAIPQAMVTWSVVSGPVTAISPQGLASAGTVHQNTAAVVRGTYAGFPADLPLTVVNIASDDFGLYAADGIDDSWQVQFFGPENPMAQATRDPDGDGVSNFFEFVAGVSPVDPASRFQLRLERVPGQPTQKRIVFSPRLPDRTYTVEFRTSLGSGTWQPLPGTPPTADTGNERTVTDTAAAAATRFYRVQVSKP